MITTETKKASRISDVNGLAMYVLSDDCSWGDRAGFDGIGIWHAADRIAVYPVYYWTPAADGNFPNGMVKSEPMAHFHTDATHIEILAAFGYSL
ncbi:hypothetical protein [Microlunatus parietis]|uniref:Uncharacterized protein n=1 Tax=Microlunatus parietis TaxID=682979 RepID=A0A7Y9LBW7_9ACTN|nr:hypothetical protein [Microlunatus parietis]NYE74249.1 hypothetical protein [Microlunatus parietis]